MFLFIYSQRRKVLDKIINQVYNVDMENKLHLDPKRYQRYERLLELLLKLINVFKDFETTPRKYGTDEIYYSLEIHTIHVIGKNPEINLTEIANTLGISKSAVSKVVKKIESKGAIYRFRALNNHKEVLFRLTPKGKKAYLGHLEYHQKHEESLFARLSVMSEEKLQNTEEVLLIFEEYSKKFMPK